MIEHQNKEVKQSIKSKYWKYIITVLLIVVCVAVAIVASILFMHREKARRVLKEAKLMQLAVRTVGAEFYGLNKSIYDSSAVDGLTEGAAKELSSLSGCSGQIYLLKWDRESLQPIHFIYIQDGFIVDYAKSGEIDNWNVYELEHVIVH